MKIKYLGHSCFLITSGEFALLTDPYLSGNALSKTKPEEVSATHLLVSHGHFDHLGDSLEIAARCGSTVFATLETAGLFPEGTSVEKGQIGGWIPAPFGGIKFTAAAHGSGVPGGLACGFLIQIEGKVVYHAGDTGLIMDMALLAAEGIDLALLPIGDRFTMGPKDALRAVRMIKPKAVVPMHYNSFPPIRQDPFAFKADVEAATGVPVTVMAIGDEISL